MMCLGPESNQRLGDLRAPVRLNDSAIRVTAADRESRTVDYWHTAGPGKHVPSAVQLPTGDSGIMQLPAFQQGRFQTQLAPQACPAHGAGAGHERPGFWPADTQRPFWSQIFSSAVSTQLGSPGAQSWHGSAHALSPQGS